MVTEKFSRLSFGIWISGSLISLRVISGKVRSGSWNDMYSTLRSPNMASGSGMGISMSLMLSMNAMILCFSSSKSIVMEGTVYLLRMVNSGRVTCGGIAIS
uniref:Uncharacterized protein n=1 Tax=Anguilla anguilla TaxID=7936 RepID=A0A0E9WMF2_ANGAN